MACPICPVGHATIFKDYIIPVVAAIMGALVAYLPLRLLARQTSRDMIVRDEKARREVELGLSRRAWVKVNMLVNASLGFHQQVEQMIAKADRDGNSRMPLWQRLSTFAAIDREPAIMFDADELALFVAAKKVAYVDDLVLLSRRHAACLANLGAFGRMKTDLHYEIARRGETTRDDNDVSTTFARVDPGMANYLGQRAEELELYTRELRSILADTAALAERTAGQFGPITQAYFHDGTLPGFERSPASEALAG